MPKLTKRAIDALKSEAADFFVWDSQIAGFGVRVMPSGAKTYQAQYRKGGRTRRVSLGRHGKITVDEARRLAKDVMGQVAMGENPAEEIAQERRAPTVAALCDRFFREHAEESPSAFQCALEVRIPRFKVGFHWQAKLFLDQVEANRTLRNDQIRDAAGDVYTEVWPIAKMSKDQIVEACRSYDSSVRDGIVGAIDQSIDFLEIVSRPSMLPVVATIWSSIETLRDSGLPLTGAVLIERYIQAVFARKEAELEQDRVKYDAPAGSRYLCLPRPIREMLTICVAWRMSGLGYQNTISREEVIEMVQEMYDVLFDVAKSSTVTPEITEGMIEFEKRFSESSLADRVEAIAAEVCSSGLMIPDPVGGNSNLRFPHKQFFEFLVAKAICIFKSPETTGCSALLMACCQDRSTYRRLRREPNAVQYLVECNGQSLDVLYQPIERVFTRTVLYMLIAAGSLTLSLRKAWPKSLVIRKSADEEEPLDTLGDNEIAKLMEEVDHQIRLSRSTVSLASGVLATTLMVTLGSLLLKVGTESMPLELATIAFGVTMAGFSIALMTVVMDLDRVHVLISFLRAHWRKADTHRVEPREELWLAARSLNRNRVCFPQNEPSEEDDFSQFLYPENHFGTSKT